MRSAEGAAAAPGETGIACAAGALAGATAAVTGAGGAARAVVGGSNSIVYSRTRRPVGQLSSRMTSMNGSCTPRSLVIFRNGRPSGRRRSSTWVPGKTAL